MEPKQLNSYISCTFLCLNIRVLLAVIEAEMTIRQDVKVTVAGWPTAVGFQHTDTKNG